MKLQTQTLDREGGEDIELADAVFAVPVRSDILTRVVNWQLAKRRQGTHKTKGRSEITGSTAKIYRQKGTGRARHGSRKAPLFVGGGVAFGPSPRDHAHALPKKVRKLGLKSALSAKAAEGKLVVLDGLNGIDGKTASLKKTLDGFGWGSVLVIDGETVEPNFERAARNLIGIDVLPQQGANVYDILRRDTLVLTRAAVEALEARLA